MCYIYIAYNLKSSAHFQYFEVRLYTWAEIVFSWAKWRVHSAYSTPGLFSAGASAINVVVYSDQYTPSLTPER